MTDRRSPSASRYVRRGLGLIGLALLSHGILTVSAARAIGGAALLVIAASVGTRLRGEGWVVSFGVALLVLAIADVGAGRLATALSQARSVRHAPDSDYASDYWVEDDVVGYRARPGAHSSRLLAARDGSTVYDVVYTIGPDGFRVTPGGPAGAYGITLLGGSFAFGEGLEDDETIAHFMAVESGLRVKNFGFHGFGMHQALALLQREDGVPGETVVLLTAPWHAPRSSCIPEYTEGTPRFVLEDGDLVRAGVCPDGGASASRSRVERLVTDSGIIRFVRVQRPRQGTIAARDVELYLEILREASRTAKQRGMRVGIAFIRAADEELSGSGWTNEAILHEMALFGDIVIDVTLGEDPDLLDPALYLHELDRHPSAEANRRRARLIVAGLSELRTD